MKWQKPTRKLLIVLAMLISASVYFTFKARPLPGPTSPQGLTVQVKLREGNRKADGRYFADVKILSKRKVVAEWKDPAGLRTKPQIESLIESMHWDNSPTLSFQLQNGNLVRLRVPHQAR